MLACGILLTIISHYYRPLLAITGGPAALRGALGGPRPREAAGVPAARIEPPDDLTRNRQLLGASLELLGAPLELPRSTLSVNIINYIICEYENMIINMRSF